MALEDEHFSMYQQKPSRKQQPLQQPAAFRRAASFAYDGVQEMGSQLRRSFRGSRRSRSITTAWHSVMKRKCEEREDEGGAAADFEDSSAFGKDEAADFGDKRRKNAGHHTSTSNVVIYAGVLRTYDMTGFSNANYKP